MYLSTQTQGNFLICSRCCIGKLFLVKGGNISMPSSFVKINKKGVLSMLLDCEIFIEWPVILWAWINVLLQVRSYSPDFRMKPLTMLAYTLAVQHWQPQLTGRLSSPFWVWWRVTQSGESKLPSPLMTLPSNQTKTHPPFKPWSVDSEILTLCESSWAHGHHQRPVC